MKPAEAILMIPEHMRLSVIRYIVHGELYEDFLRAVLEDKFVMFFELADDLNRNYAQEWASFMYNYCPKAARGEHVDQWIKDGGLKGIGGDSLSVWEELL